MKASHFIGFVLLNAFSILFRQVGGKQSANWAVHADTCRRYNQNFAGKEVQRAINIAKHAVNNLAGNNYDVIIRNFVQVLFNQDPNGGGLEWVQDVFAGEGPAKLPGIANFDRLVNEDSVVTGDLVFAPSP